jgi:hypothetical protein
MSENKRETDAFRALQNEAREIIAAYEEGADFDFVVSRLVEIGAKMKEVLE